MAKGKYAAKAANRLAELDNELLQQKCKEVTALTTELQNVRRELETERRDRSQLVLQRSDELSAKVLEQQREKAAVAAAEHKEVLRLVADYLVMMYRDRDGKVSYPNGFVRDLLPLLLPDNRERSEFIDNMLLANKPTTETTEGIK